MREDTMILELATRVMEMALDNGVQIAPEQAIDVVARTLAAIQRRPAGGRATGMSGAGAMPSTELEPWTVTRALETLLDPPSSGPAPHLLGVDKGGSTATCETWLDAVCARAARAGDYRVIDGARRAGRSAARGGRRRRAGVGRGGGAGPGGRDADTGSGRPDAMGERDGERGPRGAAHTEEPTGRRATAARGRRPGRGRRARARCGGAGRDRTREVLDQTGRVREPLSRAGRAGEPSRRRRSCSRRQASTRRCGRGRSRCARRCSRSPRPPSKSCRRRSNEGHCAPAE